MTLGAVYKIEIIFEAYLALFNPALFGPINIQGGGGQICPELFPVFLNSWRD